MPRIPGAPTPFGSGAINERSRCEDEVVPYRDVFERSPDATLVTDRRGVLRDANRAALQMLSLGRGCREGHSLAAFVEPDSVAALVAAVARVCRGQPDELVVRLRERSDHGVQVRLAGGLTSDGKHILWSLRWSGEPASRRDTRTLVELGRLVAGASSPAEIPPALARAAVEGLGVAAAAVFLVLPSGESQLAGSSGLPTDFGDFVADVDLVGGEIGEALRVAVGADHRAARTVPLASSGSVFGSLVLLGTTDELAPDAVVLLEGLVDLAATGLAGAAQYAELARAYAELRQSRVVMEKGEKLRALGQMAAGVAHDLKNILNPISLHLQLLQRVVRAENPTAAESIAAMRAALVRGVETIGRLRTFSQQSPAEGRVSADLDALLREAIGFACAKAGSGIRYAIVDRLRAPPAVLLPPSECVTVLVNLLVNAIDAMPGGGTIEVSSGASEGGSWVCISDDGPGMSPEVEHRVFEPFFTTKGDEGTGLGLAMVYSFVQRQRGRLTLRTALGEGAAFTLWFPHDAPDGPR